MRADNNQLECVQLNNVDKMKIYLFVIGGLVVLSMLLQGCNKNSKQGNTMTAPFYVKAGISSAEYNKRNEQQTKKSIDKQPAGLNFYEQRWQSKPRGAVHVEHGDYSFTVPHVLSTMGTEDTLYLDRGIYQFSIRSGLSADEFIDHDEARIEMMALLQSIVATGWHPHTELYKPRLLGKNSFYYRLEDSSLYTPDPMYTPTLEEWMALDTDSDWTFYIEDVFLTVNFRRRLNHKGNNELGVYLLTFTLTTRDEKARKPLSGNDREQWLSLWVENTKVRKIRRYKKEVELIKRGYHINTDYVDPIIHPDDPVEPDSEEALALLKYINENNK